MTISYNESLSTVFARQVRNGISETKADKDMIVYSDIFPNTKIKYGEAAMNLWSLENGYSNYLATSPTGQITGFGSSILLVDDIIKNAEEAFNANVLEKHWDFFTNTALSRLEENGKLILVMTRWANKDLAGRALEHFSSDGTKVRHINMKAYDEETDTMLCEEVLSKKSFLSKSRAMRPEIVAANYQQTPIDVKGRLYTEFKTYSGELPQFKEIKAYVDTADTGADYLCAIVYGVTMDNEAYILDVVYTKDAMEVTEPAVAKLLAQGGVNVADIESNNGGRGFARAVETRLKYEQRTNRVRVNTFHQSKNKVARILSNSTWVMDHIYFPENWRDKWKDFHDALISYQKEGKNKHDDAPDALTGVAERAYKTDRFKFK